MILSFNVFILPTISSVIVIDPFSKMGIQDEDEIYWMRLINGNNSFRVFGNFNLSIDYLEPKKGGLVS